MHRITRSKHSRIFVALAALVVAALSYFVFFDKDSTSVQPAAENKAQQKTKETQQKPAPALDLQPELDAWLKRNPGTYSVVMRDMKNNQIVAKSNEDKTYFMASLYKLYVAYLALLDAQNGVRSLSEPFLSGWSRQKCIDQMIRTSNSPCGEKYMAEQGRQKIEDRISGFGLKDTDYGAFVTSARDIDILLKRFYQDQDLDGKHQKILLDALKGNIYDETIKAGAPSGAVVANKVGFRERVEYHDVGIIYLPDGRAFGLSILTQNAGSKRIADLTRTLMQAVR